MTLMKHYKGDLSLCYFCLSFNKQHITPRVSRLWFTSISVCVCVCSQCECRWRDSHTHTHTCVCCSPAVLPVSAVACCEVLLQRSVSRLFSVILLQIMQCRAHQTRLIWHHSCFTHTHTLHMQWCVGGSFDLQRFVWPSLKDYDCLEHWEYSRTSITHLVFHSSIWENVCFDMKISSLPLRLLLRAVILKRFHHLNHFKIKYFLS